MGISSVVSYARREVFETLPGMEIATYRLNPAVGLNPTILHVRDTYYYKPDIEGRQDHVFVPSAQVARSVVHMYLTSQLNYDIDQHPAVFDIPDVAIDAENIMKLYGNKVKEMLGKQRKWFRSLIQMADDDWQISHRHGMISDIQRTAARELGLKREWLFTIEEEEGTKVECPFCGAGLLNPNAPICPHCNKVHNPIKMKELEARMDSLINPKVPAKV